MRDESGDGAEPLGPKPAGALSAAEWAEGLGEVPVGADVDDLLLEGAVKALDDAVGFGFAEESEAGDKAVEAGVGLEVVR